MQQVEPRYAAALLAACKHPEEAQAVYEVLQAYVEMLQNSEELYRFIHNPVLAPEAKKDTLLLLYPDGLPKLAKNFLFLLIDKHRFEMLPVICEEFYKLKAAKEQVLIIQVSSAMPLEKEMEEKIRKQYSEKFGAKDAVLETTLNPALIGGIRVQIGDMLFDDSILGRVEGLRRSMKQT